MSPQLSATLADRPHLSRLVAAVLADWPAHESYLGVRFADPADPILDISEELAGLILRLTDGELPVYCADYRWMCGNYVQEDLHFRRTGRYRLSSFDEVYREVYGNAAYMERYLRGILLTQVLWANQAQAFHFYVERFLARLAPDSEYLEIGPGHGLLIHFAAHCDRVKRLNGWDVSPSSIDMTRRTIAAIGVGRPVALEIHNILDGAPAARHFDAICLSEVLEHLDRPEAALDSLRSLLKPDGLVFLNVPVNSPAPDHIYMWSAPEEVSDLVRSRGFVILDHDEAPVSGYDKERARRRKVTVNALIVARRDG